MGQRLITCKKRTLAKKSRNSLGTDGITGKRPKARKRYMNYGTWNVQGSRNKMIEITSELQKMKMDIIALTETKKKGHGLEEIGKYIHVFSGVSKEQRAKRGVSLLVHKKYRGNITNWKPIDENMVKLNINLWGRRITFIAIYAPSDDEKTQIKDDFFEKLNDLVGKIGSNRELILLGDFNSRTGLRINDEVIGPYGEPNINDNGERLIDICRQNELKITNGFYRHKGIHKYTWEQHTRGIRSIIDYVIVRQKTTLKIEDVRTHRGVTCGSDHYLLKAKIIKTFTKDYQIEDKEYDSGNPIDYPKYNLESLLHESTKYLYQRRIDNYLKDPEDHTTQEIYQNIIQSIHQAAREALAYKRNTSSKKLWWSNEIEEIITQKKKAYLKWISTKSQEDRETYNNLKRETRNKTNKAKNEMWDKKCQQIETYTGGRKCSEVWRFIKNVKSTGKENARVTVIGQEQWIQYYENLLQERRPQYQEVKNPITIQGEQIIIDEEAVIGNVRKLKTGRACGPEGVYAELLKNGTKKLFRLLTIVFNRCVNGEEVPQNWKVAYISSIHKKGRKDCCSNYRGISVTSTIGRLYGRILRNMIEEEFNDEEEQCGFRAGRSCTDNVFCMKQIIEKRSSVNLATHILFVDLTKAYDSIPWCKLWDVLQSTNINQTLITALQNLYNKSTSQIKIGNRLSRPFYITKGLRQGCSISPTLFKIYVKHALMQWKRKCFGMGIPLNETTIYTLQFADDQAIIAGDKDDLQYMTRKLKETYESWGLDINTEKTKYLCIGDKISNLEIDDTEDIKACEEYKYLGITFDTSGTDEKEIRTRVTEARKIIGCLNGILWSKHITKKRKFNIYNTMIKSNLIYGSETWRITEKNKKRIEATEMDALRRSARISRMQRIRNEEIRQQMGLVDTVMRDIERKQLTWYGHVQRMEQTRLPKVIMEWVPNLRRKRGRPKKDWMEGIRKAMSARNLEEGQWEDRRQWNLDIGQRRRTF